VELSLSSPIEHHRFHSFSFYLKRDDLIHPILGGNKIRKLYFLLGYPKPIHTIVSFGSMQSNAMAAIALIAKMKKWRFIYYTRINEALLAKPQGNLRFALEQGMELRSIEAMPYDRSIAHTIYQDRTLFIPEGGRCTEANVGIQILAKQIDGWMEEQGCDLPIILPAGTGTTAYFLQEALPHRKVFAVPCVAGEAALLSQFEALGKKAPQILAPPKNYRFAKPYKELYLLWSDLTEQTGVEFDLLYDPVAFSAIVHAKIQKFFYIHQGGLLGNETMIERYKAKFGTIG